MWILKFLPDWFFYAILVMGIVGIISTYFLKFLSFIPLISLYRLPIRIASYVAIVIGLFMSGAIHDNKAWQSRVDELEAKVAIAEQQSKDANAKINDTTKKQTVKVVEKQVAVKEYITTEVAKHDSECVIPKEFIKAHNESAEERR